MKLQGCVALITGAARRVGRAIAIELARAGCDIAIHYRSSATDAADTAKEVEGQDRRAITIPAELSDPSSWPSIVDATVRRLGRLDILVNNASMFETDRPDTISEFDPTTWESMLRVNLVAPAGLCHAAAPHLAARGTGQIINMCDISSERPWVDRLSYCCSKSGLVALTRGLARAMAPDIRVNGVAPGIAVFPEGYSTERRGALTRRVPLARAGSPEEVARLVRFLVESGDYITGQIIPIDGGRSLV